jgi:amino acid transporter
MSTVMLGMIPWREAMETRTIASLFIARTFADPEAGRVAGAVMTGLILIVTASSLYALVLGYSRIPFAAARDGQFFPVFARLHPTKRFPHVSLVTIGAIAIPFCFFSLGQLVSWLILVQIVAQFIWQCAGVILLRRYRADVPQPFTMWLFPIPALVALAMWTYVFLSAPWQGQAFAVAFVLAATAGYLTFDRSRPRDLEPSSFKSIS